MHQQRRRERRSIQRPVPLPASPVRSLYLEWMSILASRTVEDVQTAATTAEIAVSEVVDLVGHLFLLIVSRVWKWEN